MFIQADVAALRTAGNRLFEQLVVVGQIGAARGWVPQVIAEGATSDVRALNAGVYQANGEFGVFATPANEGFIVAVYFQQIAPPDPKVAAANSMQI